MSGKLSKLAAAISVGALVATSATASQPNHDAAPQSSGKSKSDSRMVCRNVVMSGTRLSSRHCRTQAEWDRQERQTQEEALRQRTGPAIIPDLSAPR